MSALAQWIFFGEWNGFIGKMVGNVWDGGPLINPIYTLYSGYFIGYIYIYIPFSL